MSSVPDITPELADAVFYVQGVVAAIESSAHEIFESRMVDSLHDQAKQLSTLVKFVTDVYPQLHVPLPLQTKVLGTYTQ